ncbi:MAG: DsbA family protein [Betaproteobacteria bacterium]
MWTSRWAFFRDNRDIARWDVQCEIAEALGVDIGVIEDSIHSGSAFAHLAADYQDADRMRIEGSPSFVLDDGRQKLYGNIGFRLLEANIQELLQAPRNNEASWCSSPMSAKWRGIGHLIGAELHVRRLAPVLLDPRGNAHLHRGQILDAALPAANSTGSQTGENGVLDFWRWNEPDPQIT